MIRLSDKEFDQIKRSTVFSWRAFSVSVMASIFLWFVIGFICVEDISKWSDNFKAFLGGVFLGSHLVIFFASILGGLALEGLENLICRKTFESTSEVDEEDEKA